MKITVIFKEPVPILGDIYSEVSSDHELIKDIDGGNDAGVSIETETHFYAVPWNNVRVVTVEK